MTEHNNYWTPLTRSRFNRRRVLAAGGALGASGLAAALVGCGSGSKTSSGGAAGTGLLFTPVDTTAKATRGGTYAIYQQADIAAFNSGNGGDAGHAMNAYSRIVRYDAYKYPDRPLASTSPDAAVSWETSLDGLTWTYKLRPNLK